MDHFTLIQHFFTRVQCPHCTSHITEDGVELLREDEGMFMVSIHCHHCDSHVGVAMVGVESGTGSASSGGRLPTESGSRFHLTGTRKRRYKDPELTRSELERFNQFQTITDDDVLSAHHFIQSLDQNWTRHIPEAIRQKFQETAIADDPLPALPAFDSAPVAD